LSAPSGESFNIVDVVDFELDGFVEEGGRRPGPSAAVGTVTQVAAGRRRSASTARWRHSKVKAKLGYIIVRSKAQLKA